MIVFKKSRSVSLIWFKTQIRLSGKNYSIFFENIIRQSTIRETAGDTFTGCNHAGEMEKIKRRWDVQVYFCGASCRMQNKDSCLDKQETFLPWIALTICQTPYTVIMGFLSDSVPRAPVGLIGPPRTPSESMGISISMGESWWYRVRRGGGPGRWCRRCRSRGWWSRWGQGRAARWERAIPDSVRKKGGSKKKGKNKLKMKS